ncbi:MAG TPA: RT0821/Lpp0805 family surface protein [Gammaproteobacteria bacterium]|jgi:surface antigen|nr:RT0821/Lpp0805 family surface protein [Gammaproteobacteria bacterium]
MKTLCTFLATVLCSIALTGCQTMSNADVGTMTGAVAGGLLGSTVGQGRGQVMAIAAGAAAGALVGHAIGKNMDDSDRARMNQALEGNSVGQPAYWKNQNTGAKYKVTPVKNVTVKDNKYCREYQTVATINGQQQKMYGTACRQPDGSWKAVK